MIGRALRLLRGLLGQTPPEPVKRPIEGEPAERLEAAKQNLKQTIPPKPED